MYPNTGENLTEAAQIADRWKGYCEDLYHDEEGNGSEQEYWEKEPPPLRSEVARAIRQTASRKALGLGEFSVSYETYHTRKLILFFERYVRTLTYSILAYAYPRALARS